MYQTYSKKCYHGNWLDGFARNIGHTNSLVAEVWALRDGFMLAQNLNVRRLIIEIDAKVVIDFLYLVCDSTFNTHPYYALIYDCRSLIQIFE